MFKVDTTLILKSSSKLSETLNVEKCFSSSRLCSIGVKVYFKCMNDSLCECVVD
jgi:hypothetical protein